MKSFRYRVGLVHNAFVFVCVLSIPTCVCRAAMIASGVVGDDLCTSTLLPLTFKPSFGKTTIQPGGGVVSSGSFDQVLANAGFTQANGWTFNYGNFSLPFSGSLQVNIYDAWVGDPPTNPGLDGVSRKISPPDGTQWPRECAGATIQIEAITDSSVEGLHFIQMYTEGFNSNNIPTTKLDNPKSRSPYYDDGAVAFTNVDMSDSNYGSWFQDTPNKPETESLDPSAGHERPGPESLVPRASGSRAIARGLVKRCPLCGEPHIFRSWMRMTLTSRISGEPRGMEACR